jgi:hypothetical protein
MTNKMPNLSEEELRAIKNIKLIGFSGTLGGGISLRTNGINISSTDPEKLKKLENLFIILGAEVIHYGEGYFATDSKPKLLEKFATCGLKLKQQSCGIGEPGKCYANVHKL